MKKFALLLLLLPSFTLMLRPGVWTMHDFHLFRQYEFNLCIQEGTFPCRWAPHATLGYGQPLFNFYGQFPYWIGQFFHSFGLQIIDSVKATFILSLMLSGLSMYLLASRFWGRLGGLVSAVFYVYAPYRAVDVWVRGALPESLAFVFFPLILYFLETKKYLQLSMALALLLITHNLSLFMFLPFLGLWWLVRSRHLKIIPAGLLALMLTAFYWLPIVFESRLVTLAVTTRDYFSYAHHFTSLNQLFISRFWGYGGSVWGPNDTMSFSIGRLHWILPGVVLLVLVIRKFRNSLGQLEIRSIRNFFLFVGLGISALFLTHGKSEIIWKTIPALAYVQFPWRFLSLGTLFFSLAVGAIPRVLSPKLVPLVIGGLLWINVGFFRPDIWRSVTDQQQFSGDLWAEQISSALTDYWPISAPIVPSSPAPDSPFVLDVGEAVVVAYAPGAHRREYHINVLSDYAKISFPIVYFPGWTALVDDVLHPVFPSSPLGLVTARIPEGRHIIKLVFTDTLVRTLGNVISTLALLAVISYAAVGRRHA